jgi:putative CocE/NonD family hydrolase
MNVKVSEFGRYEGFSESRYDGWIRESLYLPMRDGTKLALDVFRPTSHGVAESNPLPVVWKAKRYLRATVKDGELNTSLLNSPSLEGDQSLGPQILISHGYVLASADMRGTGASFGAWSECSDPSVANDGYDITEWLAQQSWCDGNVGMFGASYEGRMQYSVASAGPPHLRAIMPEVSPFDWYETIHEGGIFQRRFESTGVHFRNCDVNTNVSPVDDDPDGQLVTEASALHEQLNDYSATQGVLPYRDSKNASGEDHWQERSGDALLPGVIESGVASYATTGFFAAVGLAQILWFANLSRSKSARKHRIWLGPWPAGGVVAAVPEHRAIWATENLRFFDYWLKGIENGIMDEPPVVYSTQLSTTDRGPDKTWREAPGWPLPNLAETAFYFHAGPSGTIGSVNDGLLSQKVPTVKEDGQDDYRVVYDISEPPGDQHLRVGPPGADFRPYDERCLTYTSEALDADVEVTGHPVVHLFASSSADDGDFVVHLEDVDESGTSTYVDQRRMRASHRKTGTPSYYRCGSPWHSYFESDAELIPSGEVVEVSFELLPTSYLFQRGHRIRVSIACAEEATALTSILDPPPLVSIHRRGAYLSHIVLPVVGSSAG